MEGYAPGGARRASATRSQEDRGKAPTVASHLSGAEKVGADVHQRGTEQAVSAQPAALCTGTNADTCTPLETGSEASAGRFSLSSSSKRYGRNNLNGLRGGGRSGTVGGAYDETGVATGVRRRTDKSMGSVDGGITGTGAGNGVCAGTALGRAVAAGGGDGSRALSGEPTE